MKIDREKDLNYKDSRFYFIKGVLFINNYKFVIYNGVLKVRYTKEELSNLSVASIPYKQRILISGEFSPNLQGFGSVLSGEGRLECLSHNCESVTYSINLFGQYNNEILVSYFYDYYR